MGQSKRLVVLVVSLVLVLLFGCNTKQNRPVTTVEGEDRFETIRVALALPQGSEMGECTVYGDHLYYSVSYGDPQAQFAKKVEVYELDINQDPSKASLVYTAHSPDTIWLNELRAYQSRLYWASMGSKGCQLVSLDLNTKQLVTIHTTSLDTPIVLGGDSRHLSWYREVEGTEPTSCWVYDLEKQELATVTLEQAMSIEPPGRLSMSKDNLLFLHSADNKVAFSLLDINTSKMKRQFTLAKEDGYVVPQVSGDFIVWRDKFGGTLVNVYDIKTGRKSSFDFKDMGISIFSVHLANDMLYINATNDILYVDLQEKVRGSVTAGSIKQAYPNANLMQSKISLDQQYVSVLAHHPICVAYIVRRK